MFHSAKLSPICCFKRWTHKQRLLFMLMFAWGWNLSNLFFTHTPNEADVQIFFTNSSSYCQGVSTSKNCSNNNRTAISRDVQQTSRTQTASPSNEARYRHPNFTFDFPLCFVHVGKTAGSSISCGLGLMYADCEGMPRQPPLLHTDFFHMKKNNCLRFDGKLPRIATFLMTIRNPLMRIRSWFNFEKEILPTRRNKQVQDRLRWKRGMLFRDCYDNFVDLVVNGLDLSQSSMNINNGTYNILTERPTNMTCRERAWAAILGVREFSYHEWYNYEHYWEGIKGFLSKNMTPSLLVLRTEHLLDDWSQLSKEKLFRQVNKGNPSSAVGNSSVPSNVTTTSFETRSSRKSTAAATTIDNSNRFWLNLCQAMCPEIKIYKQILGRANNINTSQFSESISEIQVLCPQYNSEEWSCQGIPKFPVIKVPRRQYLVETKKRLFTVG